MLIYIIIEHRPHSSSFRPELDVTEELEEELTNRYQKLIGVLRWSIEPRRIYILMEVSFLSRKLCYPREENLDAVYRIFRYLHNNSGKNSGRMAYDPRYELTYDNIFEVVGRDLDQWKDFYPDAQEMMPRDIPEALGNYFVIRSYVNTYHAGNMASRRSHYGIIIYINNAPISW